EPCMSHESVIDEYHPGLEGVIANETAIASVEGKDGEGGLEYRGYRIEELAEAVSYEETAFLLLHGDLPTAAQLRVFDARLPAARPDRALSPDSRLGPPDGRAADVGQCARPLRPRGERPAHRPRRQRPQGRTHDRPDGDSGRLPRADRRGTRARTSPAGTRPF